MISFKLLGNYGWFGNQLFQYAFLRTTALRLKVPFYCPRWLGDEVFNLNDKNLRAKEPLGITKTYTHPSRCCSFIKSAMEIQDGTDIIGYFHTEKYFEPQKVREWYHFRKEKIAVVSEKYRKIDFSKSVGCHLRFGDDKNIRFYLLPTQYYLHAFTKVRRKETVLVFSDDIEAAKQQFRDLKENLIYIEDNQNYEDLYLMNLCHDFVASPSTFSWWGAWLNSYSDKIIVVPKEGPLRPGGPGKNHDFWNQKYIQIRTLQPILDSYPVVTLRRLLGLYKDE